MADATVHVARRSGEAARRAPLTVVHPTPRPLDRWVCKYHLDAECAGLDRIAVDDRVHTTFPSWYALVRRPQARPCRACALEQTLVQVWSQPALQRGRPVLVTFSSQGVLDERRYGYATPGAYETSESGTRRLERVAATVGLSVHDSVVGPVCATVLPGSLARVVGRNLRTYVLDRTVGSGMGDAMSGEAVEVIDPMAMAAFWELVHETVDTGSGIGAASTWALARAMVR